MQTSVEMYEECRRNICNLVTEANQDTTIPACPDWTVRDIFGHLIGELEDTAAGPRDEHAEPQWTQSQVERYRHLTLAEAKERWQALSAELGERYPAAADHVLPDVATHEFDVRGALGNVEHRDADVLKKTALFFLRSNQALRDGDRPTLRVRIGGDEVTIGDGEPAGMLTVTPFDGARAFSGRRSIAQLRQLDWSVDPEPWIDAISILPPRETDLIE